MERTRAIGAEQMTDKKSFLPAGKNLGKNDEITEVLDKFAREQGFKDWKGLLFDDIGLNYTDCENLATLAFEQGKLAGKKELIDQMCKPMEEENALCDKRLGDCMPCEERKKRIKELKSQLKEEAKK